MRTVTVNDAGGVDLGEEKRGIGVEEQSLRWAGAVVGEGFDRGGVSEYNDGHRMSGWTWKQHWFLMTFPTTFSSISSSVRTGGVSGADYSKTHAYADGTSIRGRTAS